MANDYFNHENPLTRHTLGRAEQVNSTFNAIEAAFDKLPTPDQINRGSVAYVLDLGTVNSYVVNFARVPESYTEGMNFTMKAATTNTGPAVINVNGLGAKQIRRYDGQPLEPGDIRAGQLVILGYDGSRFLNIGAQGAEVAKARQWATSTSVVQSGEYGARGYAQQADRWANANEDVVVEGGRFSAKHWALKAMSNAGLLPDENLDIPSRSYRDLGTAAEKFRDGNFSRNVSAAAFVGSGAGLTNLNASNISSGTLPNARLSGNYSFGSLTLSGELNVSGVATMLGAEMHSQTGIILASAGQQLNRYRVRANANDSSDFGFRIERWNGESYDMLHMVVRNFTAIYHRLEVDGRLDVSGAINGNGSGLTNLNASNISSGTLPAARLPNHSASLLTSGTLPNARLSGNYSFGSLTLSGDLTANQASLGSTLYESAGGVHRYRNRANINDTNDFGWRVERWDGSTYGEILRVAEGSTDIYNDLSVSGKISGNGSGLTNLNASRLTSGAIPNARLSGDYNFNNLTLSGGLATNHIRVGADTSYVINRNTTASWLELEGGIGGGSSSRIMLYGPDNSDGRGDLRHGDTIRLRWGNSTIEADNGAGGLLPVATVSQASTANETTFPIGHLVFVRGGRSVRNSSDTVRLHTGNDNDYDIGGSGAALGGIWRHNGGAADSGTVIQRRA